MMRRVHVPPFIWLACVGIIALFWGGQAVTAAPLWQGSSANLPAPLYYIETFSGQIVRLDTDGTSRRTITHETEPVTAFDISPDGSKLAYVSGNRLIESDSNGLNPVVKFAGPALNTLDSLDLINDRVDVPVYSPDGARIAFAYNGVNLIASGTDTGPDAVSMVLPSDPFPEAADFTGSELIRFFRPRAWGPDGVHLIVDVSYYPEGLASPFLRPIRLFWWI